MKILIRIIYFFYFLWCRVYGALEYFIYSRFITTESALKRSFNIVNNNSELFNPAKDTWKNILKKFEWDSDKWYMFFDVISNTEVFCFRKKGDCDDFAILAAKVFPERFVFEGEEYNQHGIYFLFASPLFIAKDIIKKFGRALIGFFKTFKFVMEEGNYGHVITAFKAKDDLKFTVISVKRMYTCRDIICKVNNLDYSWFVMTDFNLKIKTIGELK